MLLESKDFFKMKFIRFCLLTRDWSWWYCIWLKINWGRDQHLRHSLPDVKLLLWEWVTYFVQNILVLINLVLSSVKYWWGKIELNWIYFTINLWPQHEYPLHVFKSFLYGLTWDPVGSEIKSFPQKFCSFVAFQNLNMIRSI